MKLTTKPMHRLQIRQSAKQCTIRGHPLPFPKLHPGPCNSVGLGIRPRTDTDTQTRVTNIHFASSTTQSKCNNYNRNYNYSKTASYLSNPIRPNYFLSPLSFYYGRRQELFLSASATEVFWQSGALQIGLLLLLLYNSTRSATYASSIRNLETMASDLMRSVLQCLPYLIH